MATSTPFSLRLDPDLRSRLEAAAKQADRSASYIATQAIKSFLTAQEAKAEAIKAAIVEAEEGNFISSEAMGKWVSSWEDDKEHPKPQADIKS